MLMGSICGVAEAVKAVVKVGAGFPWVVGAEWQWTRSIAERGDDAEIGSAAKLNGHEARSRIFEVL